MNGTIRGHDNSFCDKGRKTTACFRKGEKSVFGRRYKLGKLLMRASVLFPNTKFEPTKPENNLISSKTDSDVPIPFSQGNKQPSTSHTKHACCLGEKRIFCHFFWRWFASFFSWPFSLWPSNDWSLYSAIFHICLPVFALIWECWNFNLPDN